MLYILITPFVPLSPMEVAERFAVAKTAAEARRITTLRLPSAMEALFKLPDESHPDDRFGLYYEGPSAHGHVVGVLHVLKEPCGYISVEGQPAEPWFTASTEYLQLPNFATAAPSKAPPATATKSKSSYQPTSLDLRMWCLVIALVGSAAARAFDRRGKTT